MAHAMSKAIAPPIALALEVQSTNGTQGPTAPTPKPQDGQPGLLDYSGFGLDAKQRHQFVPLFLLAAVLADLVCQDWQPGRGIMDRSST